MREHRCTALAPPAPLEIDKQRRLCLTEAHATCATFIAAGERRRQDLAGVGIDERRLAERRHVALTRPIPIALEQPSAVPGPVALVGGSRQAARGGLVALMVLAAFVLVLARFGGMGLTGAAPSSPPATSGRPAALASATPTPSSSPPPTATPAVTPVPTPTLVPTPSPTATIAATRRYVVRPGDTLSGIATRFRTTVTILQRLNRIADPRLIFVGQVLKIP